MFRKFLSFGLLSAFLVSGAAFADALTQIIQRDLETLGYEPGNTDGEPSVETAIAISKFQSENGLEVTGEASPQLAGIIKAAMNGNAPAAPSAAPAAPVAPAAVAAVPASAPQAPAAPAIDQARLAAAQQTCLQQKANEAREAEGRRRGFARLARAVSRTADALGGDGVSNDIERLSADVYDAGAIASDFQGAAEDLGLTESDVEECRNPL